MHLPTNCSVSFQSIFAAGGKLILALRCQTDVMAFPQHSLFATLKIFVNIATLLYYRVFRFNTLQPILLIAAYTSQPEGNHKVLYHLDRWRTRKLSELQFISVAVSDSRNYTSLSLGSLQISPFGELRSPSRVLL